MRKIEQNTDKAIADYQNYLDYEESFGLKPFTERLFVDGNPDKKRKFKKVRKESEESIID